MEKTGAPRVPVAISITMRYPDRQVVVIATIRDLSATGMFVQTRELPRIGDSVRFNFELERPKEKIQGIGIVHWLRNLSEAHESGQPSGIGLHFSSFAGKASRHIERYLIAHLPKATGGGVREANPDLARFEAESLTDLYGQLFEEQDEPVSLRRNIEEKIPSNDLEILMQKEKLESEISHEQKTSCHTQESKEMLSQAEEPAESLGTTEPEALASDTPNILEFDCTFGPRLLNCGLLTREQPELVSTTVFEALGNGRTQQFSYEALPQLLPSSTTETNLQIKCIVPDFELENFNTLDFGDPRLTAIPESRYAFEKFGGNREKKDGYTYIRQGLWEFSAYQYSADTPQAPGISLRLPELSIEQLLLQLRKTLIPTISDELGYELSDSEFHHHQLVETFSGILQGAQNINEIQVDEVTLTLPESILGGFHGHIVKLFQERVLAHLVLSLAPKSPILWVVEGLQITPWFEAISKMTENPPISLVYALPEDL
ncbi:MAG: PilZ domain-containing protein [Myxococcota bacterium]|nr:PilZ domain-containing protein [Myxococcota bacterium]